MSLTVSFAIQVGFQQGSRRIAAEHASSMKLTCAAQLNHATTKPVYLLMSIMIKRHSKLNRVRVGVLISSAVFRVATSQADQTLAPANAEFSFRLANQLAKE